MSSINVDFISNRSGDGAPLVTNGLRVSGIVTATGGFNIGIQSSGTDVTTGVVTALNFVGAGNTFSYNPTTKIVDISIVGGGGASVSIGTVPPLLPSAGNLWYNTLLARTFIYYTDADSSQWVDISPFNIGTGTTTTAQPSLSIVSSLFI